MKKQAERVKRSYTRAAKKYLDSQERKQALSEFAAFITRFDELVKAVEEGTKTAETQAKEDPDSYWFENAELLNDLQNEFYELQRQAETIGNVMQNLTQGSKDVKFMENELSRLRKSSSASAKSIVPTLEEIIKQVKENFSSAWVNVVADPDEAQYIMEAIFELRRDWDEAIQDLYDDPESNPYEEIIENTAAPSDNSNTAEPKSFAPYNMPPPPAPPPPTMPTLAPVE